jgi:hypothetical protein
VAVVEVDTDTGKVTLSRMITVDDAGRLLNPLLVEGQRHGGIAQGVAQALLEEVVYDADGNPLHLQPADYTFISACEVPSFELVAMETPTPINPMGRRASGSRGRSGPRPAVQSAVVDALVPPRGPPRRHADHAGEGVAGHRERGAGRRLTRGPAVRRPRRAHGLRPGHDGARRSRGRNEGEWPCRCP